MKTTLLLLTLLVAGCSTAPKNLYVHPERYNCDLIIPTIWDGTHPVSHFEHELVIGLTYYDYMGMQYTLVETDQPGVFSLRVKVAAP
tara:strand:+ start:33 stop:293 length:261 start_codon:yes stop_codon:yes gene_type:complete